MFLGSLGRQIHKGLVTTYCMGLRGLGKRDGGGKYNHHPYSVLTWRNWKRKRKAELGGPLSLSPMSSGGVEIIDDETQQLMVERVIDGQFYDTQFHYHYQIKDKDVGSKVNVGESVISELQRQFHIPREEALRMVRTNGFLLVSDSAILQTLYFLKDHQISAQQLMRVPWILLQHPDKLQEKFHRIVDPYLFESLTEGLGFAYFSLRQIKKYRTFFFMESSHFPNHRNRVYYIAEQLETPVAIVTEKIVKPKQVLKMDIYKINHLISVLKKCGVMMDDIVRDMWIFCHNIDVIENRLRLSKEAGCVHPKPWICHSSDFVFGRYLERVKARTQMLGQEGDLATYISDRLDCSVEEVKIIFKRNPSLGRSHVAHVKSKLDLLLSAGFTKQDIRVCLRVLQHSERRTKNRIEEMKSLGEFPFPISVLFKQPKTYFNIVQKIKAAKQVKKEVEEEEKVAKEQ